MSSKRIVLVSDSTGETAQALVQAAMVQFPSNEAEVVRFKNVRTEAQIDAVCEEASQQGDLIVFTLVSPQLRTLLLQKSHLLGLSCVDLLGPLLTGLAKYFGFEPKSVAGLLRDMNETYFRRIEAMEYTLQHDDGKDLTRLDFADLVLLGISRTSKTPLSMYLSHQGWRVANIPVIEGFEIPPELLEVDPRRVICLTIDPEHLAKIRRARLQRLGQDQGGDYADLESITQEIEYANTLFKKNRKWALFNVTGKALEETASEIIKLMASRKLVPGGQKITGQKAGVQKPGDFNNRT